MEPQAKSSLAWCWADVVAAVMLIGSLTIIIIPAGHGAIPVGLLLIFGLAHITTPIVLVPWLGVLLLLTSIIPANQVLRAGFGAAAMIALAIAWLILMQGSERPGWAEMTSIPFGIMMLVNGFLVGRRGADVLKMLREENKRPPDRSSHP